MFKLLLHHFISLFLLEFSLFVSVWMEHYWLSINFSKMVSENIKSFINIFWGYCRPDSRILNLNRNKLTLILPIRIILKPIIQMVSINTPWSINISCIFNTDSSHLIKENSFRCHKWNVILLDEDVTICDCDVFILVEDLQILCHFLILYLYGNA